MSDLISREKIRDYIKGEINPYGKPFEGTAYELGLKIMRYIDSMDSVYDIDKVVEELETNKQNALEVEESIKEYNVWNKAIEIVKQGGVDVANDATTKNDDVCEWKAIGANDNWSTGCDKNSTHNVFGVAWFNRCPYCGRKIKLVE